MSELYELAEIPVIDISSLVTNCPDLDNSAERDDAIRKIGNACRNVGFFYISNHSIDRKLIDDLLKLSRKFFKKDLSYKNQISMSKGGKAWRGYFPVGDEITSGVVDQKEGIYFGVHQTDEQAKLDTRHLHGQNLYTDDEDGVEMKKTVEEYIAKCSALGEVIMSSIACSLGLDKAYFAEQFENPTALFRIFNYPPHDEQYGENSYAVGEHCDYGFVTILYQDECGGLEVRNLSTPDKWVKAPYIKDTFIINIGDALEHCTGGLLRATPHRVCARKDATSDRLSLPFFYDPNFNSPMKSLVSALSPEDQELVHRRKVMGESSNDSAIQNKYIRWDNTDVTLYNGTYGDYLLSKVSKVFPELAVQQNIKI